MFLLTSHIAMNFVPYKLRFDELYQFLLVIFSVLFCQWSIGDFIMNTILFIVSTGNPSQLRIWFEYSVFTFMSVISWWLHLATLFLLVIHPNYGFDLSTKSLVFLQNSFQLVIFLKSGGNDA